MTNLAKKKERLGTSSKEKKEKLEQSRKKINEFDYTNFDTTWVDRKYKAPTLPNIWDEPANRSNPKGPVFTPSAYKDMTKQIDKFINRGLRTDAKGNPYESLGNAFAINKFVRQQTKGDTLASMAPIKIGGTVLQGPNYAKVPGEAWTVNARGIAVPSSSIQRQNKPQLRQNILSSAARLSHQNRALKSLGTIAKISGAKTSAGKVGIGPGDYNASYAAKLKSMISGRPEAEIAKESASSSARLSKISTTRSRDTIASWEPYVAEANKLLEQQGADYRFQTRNRRRRQGRYAPEIIKVYWGEPYSTSYSNFYKGRTRTFTNTKTRGTPIQYGLGIDNVFNYIDKYHQKSGIVDQFVSQGDNKQAYQQFMQQKQTERDAISNQLQQLEAQEKQLAGNVVYYKNQVVQGRSFSYERDPAKREQLRKAMHESDAKLSEVRGKISQLRRQLQNTSNPQKAKQEFYDVIHSEGQKKQQMYQKYYGEDKSLDPVDFAFVPDEKLAEIKEYHGDLTESYKETGEGVKTLQEGLSKFKVDTDIIMPEDPEKQTIPELETKTESLINTYEDLANKLQGKQLERVNKLKTSTAQNIDKVSHRQLEHVKQLKSKGLITPREYRDITEQIKQDMQQQKSQSAKSLSESEAQIKEGKFIPTGDDTDLTDDVEQLEESTKKTLADIGKQFEESTKEIKKQKSLEAFGGVTKPRIPAGSPVGATLRRGVSNFGPGPSRTTLGTTGQ